jgi:hypothetical protein
LRYITYFIYI